MAKKRTPLKHAVERAQWEVIWAKGPDNLVTHDCGADFWEARRIYMLALKGGKKMVTLRCKNVAFPIPGKYRPKIKALNRMGVFWCGYCTELRRFDEWDGYYSESGAWSEQPGYYCPICEIPAWNDAIQRDNPVAKTMADRRIYGKRGSG